MRAWRVTGVGPPSAVLDLVDVDPPDPPPGFLRLRVDAAAVGLPDVLMCAGTYPLTPATPFTPGQEIVGVVTAVGPDVDSGLVGARVMGVTAFYLGWGGLAEETLAAAATVFPAPDLLDDTHAAGFHIPFQTAWIGLRERAGLLDGETLVVLGASGGSGSAAVLLGRAIGARVVAVAGGDDKVAFCRALGADHVIDHRQDDVAEAVRELTDGRGADVVFDPVGAEAGEQAGTVMASGGRFLLVGFAGGRWPVLEPGALVHGNSSVLGVYAGAHDRDDTLATYAELFALLDSGALTPLPTTTFRFDAAGAALETLRRRDATGKLVVVPADSRGEVAR